MVTNEVTETLTDHYKAFSRFSAAWFSLRRYVAVVSWDSLLAKQMNTQERAIHHASLVPRPIQHMCLDMRLCPHRESSSVRKELMHLGSHYSFSTLYTLCISLAAIVHTQLIAALYTYVYYICVRIMCTTYTYVFTSSDSAWRELLDCSSTRRPR